MAKLESSVEGASRWGGVDKDEKEDALGTCAGVQARHAFQQQQ
jgi:hypothetical protein